MLGSQDTISGQNNIVLFQLNGTGGAFWTPVNQDFSRGGRLGLNLRFPPRAPVSLPFSRLRVISEIEEAHC